jgi:hypothetical protein
MESEKNCLRLPAPFLLLLPHSANFCISSACTAVACLSLRSQRVSPRVQARQAGVASWFHTWQPRHPQAQLDGHWPPALPSPAFARLRPVSHATCVHERYHFATLGTRLSNRGIVSDLRVERSRRGYGSLVTRYLTQLAFPACAPITQPGPRRRCDATSRQTRHTPDRRRYSGTIKGYQYSRLIRVDSTTAAPINIER